MAWALAAEPSADIATAAAAAQIKRVDRGIFDLHNWVFRTNQFRLGDIPRSSRLQLNESTKLAATVENNWQMRRSVVFFNLKAFFAVSLGL
jgi:hypothetical protein